MPSTNYTRLTEAGAIKASPGKLYCLIVSNWDGDPAYVVLNDDTDGTSDEVSKFYVGASRTEVFNFNPGITLNTGIYIGTFSTSKMEVTGVYD